MKLYQIDDRDPGLYYFTCPGCKTNHPIRSAKPLLNPEWKCHVWGFNGDFEKPTFTPSLLVYGSATTKRCHSFIKDGMIQFLADCEHELRGKTVPIPDYDDELF